MTAGYRQPANANANANANAHLPTLRLDLTDSSGATRDWMARGSHSFTCHPHVYPRIDLDILHAFRKHSPDGVARARWRTSGSAYYSSIDPERIKGWVGLVGWPYSGWLTHISGHPSVTGQAWDRESLPVKDRCSTTVPRLKTCFCVHEDELFMPAVESFLVNEQTPSPFNLFAKMQIKPPFNLQFQKKIFLGSCPQTSNTAPPQTLRHGRLVLQYILGPVQNVPHAMRPFIKIIRPVVCYWPTYT